MAPICGPGKLPCRADVKNRLKELEEHTATVKCKQLLVQVFMKNLENNLKRVATERHHVEYHRRNRIPHPDEKMCPAPTAPPPCNALLRSDNVDLLCEEFKALWPQFAQVLAEKTAWKMENEKLKRKIAELKAEFEADADVDPLEFNKRRASRRFCESWGPQ